MGRHPEVVVVKQTPARVVLIQTTRVVILKTGS
jgi:hypothetical protein